MQVKRSDSMYSGDTVSILSADDQITALNSKVCAILVTVTTDNLCIDLGEERRRGDFSPQWERNIPILLNFYIRVT